MLFDILSFHFICVMLHFTCCSFWRKVLDILCFYFLCSCAFLFSVQLCIWGGVTRRALSYVCELPWVPLLLNIRVRVDLGRYTQTKNYRWRNWDRWEIKLLSVMGLWLHWHKNTRWFPSINLRTYVSRQHISVEICFI